MASLTDQIPTVGSGRPIVEPNRQTGGGFLSGLANLASDGIKAYANNQANQARTAEAAREAGGRKVLNEAEIFYNQNKAQQTAEIRAGQAGEYLEFEDIMGGELTDEVRNLRRGQRAVQQGRQSQEAFDIRMEKFITTMNNKFPEYAADLGKYMQARGFSHHTWREAALEDQMVLGGDKAQVDGYSAMVKTATEEGWANLNLTNDQLYQMGVKVTRDKVQAEIAAKASAEARAAAGEKRDNWKFMDNIAKEQMFSAASSSLSASLGGLVDTLQNLVIGADSNDAAYARLQSSADDVDMLFDKGGEHIIQRYVAQGMDADTADKLRKQVADRKQAVKDIFYGSSSRFEQRNRAFKSMQTDYGMSAEKALPFYMFAKRVVGAAGVEGIFGGDISSALSPELKKKIESEVQNWDPTNVNEGMDILAMIGNLAKGNIQLSDIRQDQLTGDVMRGLNAQVVQNSKNILDPEPDNPEEWNTFLNSLGHISVAGLEFTPATKDLKALNWTLGAITNDRHLNVLTMALKNPEYASKARPVMLAGRQATAKVLEVTRTTAPGSRLTTNKNGVFLPPTLPKDTTVPMMDETGMAGAFDKGRSYRPEDKEAADIMNRSVNYLASTAALDPQYKGYSHQELVLHYSGVKRLQPKTEGEKPPADINQSIDAFETQLRVMSNDISDNLPFQGPNQAKWEPVAHAAAERFGVPKKVASFLFGQESGWNPDIGQTKIDNNGDGKPDSSAVGIGQFIESTGREFGLVGDGFDHRGDAEKSINASMNYLSKLYKRFGNWEQALNAYGVIDRRNFKSDKDYQSVINRARAAISGD